jgi:hypothetical protein
MFFVWVLAGEIFVDADNRKRLEHRAQLHPVLERIMQIHVTEEARHMRFAEVYLRQRWAGLHILRRLQIAHQARVRAIEAPVRELLHLRPHVCRCRLQD